MRLNKYIRQQIGEKILKHSFEKRAQTQVQERREFYAKAYSALYDKKTLRKMRSLPKGWLPLARHINVMIGKERYRIESRMQQRDCVVCPSIYSVPQEPDTNLLVLEKHTGYISTKINDTELIQLFADMLRKEKVLTSSFYAAEVKVDQMLRQASTFKSLVKLWPECKPFLPDEQQVTTTSLAVLPDSLNKMLGLT